MQTNELLAAYDRLTESAGYVQLGKNTTIEITGSDRLSFLNSFCTNEVKNLENGQVREAFFLNGKGKAVGHGYVANLNDRTFFVGSSTQADELLPHLDRYIIREDVQLTDWSSEIDHWFVAGEKSTDWLKQNIGITADLNRCLEACWHEIDMVVIRIGMAGDGYLLLVSQANSKRLSGLFSESNLPPCSRDALEVLRIEHRTPWFGTEISGDNLPQELDRDDQAISFTKGCYLGQETVARIDSLGRVNRLLRKFKLSGDRSSDLPLELIVDGKTVGRITSVAYSPREQHWLGLGFVRRENADAGTVINDTIQVL